MSMINWIFDIYQHSKIDEVRQEAADARREAALVRTQAANGANIDTERLVRALEELALSVKTVQRMLLEKGICSQSELGDLLRRVDLEDGREDGRTPLL